MRRLREQAEARAREPGHELDRDEEAGGPDRDERGTPLRRHGEGYGVADSTAKSRHSRVHGEFPAYPLRVKICPSCGRENADDARFCSFCATSLDAEAPRARSARSSRASSATSSASPLARSGWTRRTCGSCSSPTMRASAPSSSASAARSRSSSATRSMAVFGAPVAHEDDPERAVRAALAIRDELAEDGELEVRIGITTGEALDRARMRARSRRGNGLGRRRQYGRPAPGRRRAGRDPRRRDDATARPSASIEYRASRRRSTRRARPRRSPSWEALRARAAGRRRARRSGAARRTRAASSARCVRPLARVDARARAAARHARRCSGNRQVPPRLRALQAIVEDGAFGTVSWRHGRSLPYGEGVTLLGAQRDGEGAGGDPRNGRRETRPREAARAPSARFVSDPADADWVERHLRSAARPRARATDAGRPARRGVRGLAALPRGDRGRSARSSSSSRTCTGPTTACSTSSTTSSTGLSGVPLLVLCTARPELLDAAARLGRRQGRTPRRLSLSPLSDDETATLIDELLGRSALDADAPAALLEQAGGNPLYAEEFVRMVARARRGDARAAGDRAGHHRRPPRRLPERGEGAAPGRRRYRAGSSGSAAARRSERWTLEERLHALERKEFVRRERRSVGRRRGRVRVPPRARARRRVRADPASASGPTSIVAAAEWIESLGRPDDHAEMLAHHYVSALEFARCGRSGHESICPDRARAAFAEGGRPRARAERVRAAAALLSQRALELSQPDDPIGPSSSCVSARTLHARRRTRRARARRGARASSSRRSATSAQRRRRSARRALPWHRGDRERFSDTLAASERWLVGPRPSSRQGDVLARLADGMPTARGEYERGVSSRTRGARDGRTSSVWTTPLRAR